MKLPTTKILPNLQGDLTTSNTVINFKFFELHNYLIIVTNTIELFISKNTKPKFSIFDFQHYSNIEKIMIIESKRKVKRSMDFKSI